MQLFKDFGFEPTFFLAQVVNFLILAYIFKRFLYKPVLNALRTRKAAITRGLEEAEAARVALERAEAKKDEIIKAATLEAEKIIDETKKSSQALREDLTAQSKKEAEKIIAEAKTAAEIEFEKARVSAQDLSLDLSKKLLDKILSEIFTRDEREKIIKRNVRTFEKYE